MLNNNQFKAVKYNNIVNVNIEMLSFIVNSY